MFTQWRKTGGFASKTLKRQNQQTQKATLLLWMKFSSAKLAINLLLMGDHTTRLGRKLCGNIYINDRCPGRPITMDTSRLRIGRNSFLNRLQCLSVQFDQTNGICLHKLRIGLKKTFIK